MSSKNINIFVTTYEKVLSILNKVKDFIRNNTNNYEKILEDLDWVAKVITNKTLYSYEVKKEKLSEDHKKISDFVNQYNEEIINLNKKHALVRDILSFRTNKDFLKKPSLILKKITSNELTDLTYNKLNKKNEAVNPLGKWILDIYNKKEEENSKLNDNNKNSRNIQTPDKIIIKKEMSEINNDIQTLSEFKEKVNHNIMTKSSSLSTITHNKNKDKGVNKNNNKINKTVYNNKSKGKKNTSFKKNRRLNLYSMNKTMERYFFKKMEQIRKKNIEKSMIKQNNNINQINNIIPNTKIDPEYLNPLIEKHFEFMKSIIDKDFNIFDLKKLVGYKNVLPLMCHFMFKFLGLIDPKIINTKKLISCLTNISEGYLESTLYHNSLHGADVCHSLFIYALYSNFEEICETTVLDLLGLVVSATGHDLGHPGYNNNFHVNSHSELALTYNDISCLENFHTSTLFRILRKDENNIFENMDVSNYKHIRKRMVNQILATDMINHAMVLSSVKAKITEWQSSINNNTDNNTSESKKFVFLSGIEKTKFDEQQTMLNYLIHTADLGHNTHKFHISLQWIELLTYEFWNQGDVEREKNLTISFLCDRNNVDVPSSQVGFLKGFILSTFDILVTMFPSLGFSLTNAKDNIKTWQKLAEQKRRTGFTPEKKNKSKNEEDN